MSLKSHDTRNPDTAVCSTRSQFRLLRYGMNYVFTTTAAWLLHDTFKGEQVRFLYNGENISSCETQISTTFLPHLRSDFPNVVKDGFGQHICIALVAVM